MVGAWTNPIIHHSMRKNSSKGQGKILSRGDVGAMMAVTVVSSCDEVLTPAIMQAERRPSGVKNHCKSGSAQFRAHSGPQGNTQVAHGSAVSRNFDLSKRLTLTR